MYLHIPGSLLFGKRRWTILKMKLDFGLFSLSVSGNPLVGNKIWLEFANQPKYELLKEQKNKWVALGRNLSFNQNSYSSVINMIKSSQADVIERQTLTAFWALERFNLFFLEKHCKQIERF